MPESGLQQQIHGSFNAQAAEGGIATVTVYQGVAPAPIAEEDQAGAAALLAPLPLDKEQGEL